MCVCVCGVAAEVVCSVSVMACTVLSGAVELSYTVPYCTVLCFLFVPFSVHFIVLL